MVLWIKIIIYKIYFPQLLLTLIMNFLSFSFFYVYLNHYQGLSLWTKKDDCHCKIIVIQSSLKLKSPYILWNRFKRHSSHEGELFYVSGQIIDSIISLCILLSPLSPFFGFTNYYYLLFVFYLFPFLFYLTIYISGKQYTSICYFCDKLHRSIVIDQKTYRWRFHIFFS